MNKNIVITFLIIFLVGIIITLSLVKPKPKTIVKREVITKEVKVKVPVSKIDKAKFANWIYRNSFRCSRQQANRYATIILHHAHPLLVASIIKNESSFNITAYSKTGAIGLMQIMPTKDHLKQLKAKGIINDVRDLFNANTNINAGVFIFNDILRINKNNILKGLIMYCGGNKSYAKKVLETLGQLTIEVKEN